MVRHSAELECPRCGYEWLYKGRKTHPDKIQCHECWKYFQLPEHAVDKERRVIG